MRKILALLFLLGLPAAGYSQTSVDLPGMTAINLNSLVQNAGVADFIDNHKRNWAGPSIKVAWYPNDPANSINPSDLAWAGLEVACPWDTANGKPAGGFLWLGLRGDVLSSKVIPTKLGHFSIPNFEFGPGGGYIYNTKQWVYFLGFAKHF